MLKHGFTEKNFAPFLKDPHLENNSVLLCYDVIDFMF